VGLSDGSHVGSNWEGGYTQCKECGALRKTNEAKASLTSGGVCIDRNFCKKARKEIKRMQKEEAA
jgi:hypothetical protein